MTEASLLEGLVFRVHSGNYFVQTESGVVVCKLRGNLKKELVYSTSLSQARRVQETRRRRATDPIAVGDRVKIDPAVKMIVEILPRRSELARFLPLARTQHTLVANLDLLFPVFSALDPPPEFSLLDRFLVMAESAEIGTEIIVTKMDLLTDNGEAQARTAFGVYEKIGCGVHYVSARQGRGLDEMKVALEGRITAFAGQSGVGKSSLLNALLPGLSLKTGEIGMNTKRGRQTTTTAELVPVPGIADAWVADTPGLRWLEFWDVDRDDLPHCFPEFAPFLSECKFNNCRHHTELGCAVRAAVENGTIDRGRYASFLAMS